MPTARAPSLPLEVSNKRFNGDPQNAPLCQLCVSMLAWRSITVNRRIMMNIRLIGAAALSLVLATPAMATNQRYHDDYGRVIRSELPAQDYGNFYEAPQTRVRPNIEELQQEQDHEWGCGWPFCASAHGG
jgi:hypothetical protein